VSCFFRRFCQEDNGKQSKVDAPFPAFGFVKVKSLLK